MSPSRTANVPPGRCRFCGATDAEVDGDRLSWLDQERTCCTKYDCRNKHFAELRRKPARPRRRTPADVHQLILQERAAKRKRWRDAAKARGLLRSRGEGQ